MHKTLKQIICLNLLVLAGAFTMLNAQDSLRIYAAFDDQRLPDIFQYLEKEYGLRIAYDPVNLKDIRVTAQLTGESLKEAISQLLEDTKLQFRITEDRDVLVRQHFDRDPSQSEFIRVRGFVYDLALLEPLVGAAVIIGPGKGASTDKDGWFDVRAKRIECSDTLMVSYLGYKTLAISFGDLPEEDRHVFYLNPQVNQIGEVEVRDHIPLVTRSLDGGITMNSQELSDLPSFVGGLDVLRSLQLLPGISASDDLSSEANVRGASSEGNLVVLDGITLYRTDHYLGIFSAINPGVAGQVSLYKNDFPIEFGGRTSSVIDIQTRPPVLGQFGGGLDINLLTSNLRLDIPLGQNMSLMAGGRITNTDLADTKLFDPLDQNMRDPFLRDNPKNPNALNRVQPLEPDFRFNDLNLKWTWQLTPQTSFRASYFQSADDLSYRSYQELRTRFMNIPILNIQEHQENWTWENQGWSLTTEHAWNEGFTSSLLISRSEHTNANQVNTLLVKARPQGIDTAGFINQQNNIVDSWDINVKNTFEVSRTSKLHGGYQFNRYDLQSDIDVDDRNVLFQDSQADLHTGYVQFILNEKKWDLRLGSRISWYQGTKDWYLSPRLGVGYHVSDAVRFKGSAGRNYQFLRQLFHEDRYGRTYEFWVLADAHEFSLARSDNYMMGLTWSKKNFSMDVELFHRKTDGILEHAKVLNGIQTPEDNSGDAAPYEVFSGKGITYGLDLLLKKSIGYYDGWLSYTLSKTEHQFPEINQGEPFPGQYDRRHQLQLANQYRIKDWQFSLTYVFASGRPYTDISAILGLLDRRIVDPEKRLRYLPDYHRVDLSVNYLFNISNLEARVGFSVFNLFDHNNVKYQQYTFSLDPLDVPVNNTGKNTVVGTELDMLGFTPNVSFSLEW